MKLFITLLMLMSLTLAISLAEQDATVTTDPNYHLSLVNKIRADNGKSPLKLSPCLMDSAQFHSEYQANTNTMTHDDPNGGLYERFTVYGSTNYTAGAAENVAAGQQSDDSVVTAWKNSAGHFANMIGDYQLIGIGLQVSGKGTPYWTQQFTSGACVHKNSSSRATFSVATILASVVFALAALLL
ncbi:hypothetical protein SAMD00019534_029420, partial [Acytostelium subglobosum LB1]|uniref:hypothetical protein n=1 Tax=Acytostelium subglobosum LB1 TaxID=1410327 RepID=UPI000644BC34